MKHFFKYFLLVLIISACKVESKKQTKFFEKNKVTILSEKETVTKQKDTSNIKSAIGKSYNKYLNEIEEFKGYYSNGGYGIIDNFNEIERNGKYSNYGLSTVEIFEENKKTGISKRKGIKYIVMTNEKKVIDYIDIQKLNIPKQYVMHDEVWLNNKRDWELFAYAKQNDKEEQFIHDIYKVFRADKETGKIFEISTKGVKVQDLNYGF